MVGIWWKNNVKHLPRVQMYLTAFMFWEICIFIPVMNTQLHGTSNYEVLIYYKPNAYPLFHETSLALSCCISQHEGVLLGKIWEFEMSYCFRWLLDCTATCSQPSLFLGKTRLWYEIILRQLQAFPLQGIPTLFILCHLYILTVLSLWVIPRMP